METGNLVPLLFGAVVGGVGVVRTWRVLRLRRHGVHTTGTVVGLDKKLDDESRLLYAPVVSYVGVDGRTREFTVAVHTATPIHRIGERVPVMYLPGERGSAWLHSTRHNLREPGILLGAGVLTIALALLL